MHIGIHIHTSKEGLIAFREYTGDCQICACFKGNLFMGTFFWILYDAGCLFEKDRVIFHMSFISFKPLSNLIMSNQENGRERAFN